MGYKDLKERVYLANMELVSKNLVILTWGNASEIDREKGVFAIKPSGVDYSLLKIDDIVVVDLNGKTIEGKLNPSSDMPTHLELYKAFKTVGGIVHTHSTYATGWAQAGMDLPCYGTTHADYFYGSVPCTSALSENEIKDNYEKNTGLKIIEHFTNHQIDESACPAVLVKNHAPFTWGKNAAKAVENAYVLEQFALMETLTKINNKDALPADKFLSDKHYFRKHGKGATYGQN